MNSSRKINYGYCDLEIEDFLLVKKILELDNGKEVELISSPFGNSLMFNGEETELYLKSSIDDLIISRIALKKQRVGTGTKLLDELKRYAVEKGFKGIVVESALTHEINCFCKKHGFTPIPYQGMEIDGKFFGNHRLKLK